MLSTRSERMFLLVGTRVACGRRHVVFDRGTTARTAAVKPSVRRSIGASRTYYSRITAPSSCPLASSMTFQRASLHNDVLTASYNLVWTPLTTRLANTKHLLICSCSWHKHRSRANNKQNLIPRTTLVSRLIWACGRRRTGIQNASRSRNIGYIVKRMPVAVRDNGSSTTMDSLVL
jgi:hypothetical protein